MQRLIVWHRWCPPPEAGPEAVAQASLWRIQARQRLFAQDAELIAELGGTLVVSLPPAQLEATIEVCLNLSRDIAEEENLEVGSVAHALTLGPVERTKEHSPLVGDAIDRAALLANQALSGDVILDQAAQTAVSSVYLFAGVLRAAPGVHGARIDRGFPHRAACASALAQLGSHSFSSSAEIHFDTLRRVSAGHGRQRIVLVGPFGAGASTWIERLHQTLRPSAWLDIRCLGAGFAPLSGLRYALMRLAGDARIEHVLNGDHEADQHALVTLRTVREGGVALRRDATMALRQYVGRCSERSGQRALISVNPVPMIDPATISVVAEVAREGGPDCLVVMRVLPDGKAPDAFLRGGGIAEIRIPSMPQAEARNFALAALGKGTPNDIVRRAANMGGSLPFGICEAIRVMISNGDIVPDEGGFRWRQGPLGAGSPIPPETLLSERIDALSEDTRRVLEVVAWAPDASERELIQDVALLDGMAAHALQRAIDDLSQKALVRCAPDGGHWVSHSVREVVLKSMGPLRTSDLSLRLAGALSRRVLPHALFARADVAFYLSRGGRPQSAVDTLLEAAMAAAQHGFVRSGVRLAAAAVECNPSSETRAKAAAIAQNLGRSIVTPVAAPNVTDSTSIKNDTQTTPTPAPTPASLHEEALYQAIQALRAHDFDAFERALEVMVAAGRDGAHIDRLRALSLLERGDMVGASEQLGKAVARAPGKPEPRTQLARATWLFANGEKMAAIREALGALVEVRRSGHARGERAVLLTLSSFYRHLGHEGEASELAVAAARPNLRSARAGGSSGS